jgi:hypothetical protein
LWLTENISHNVADELKGGKRNRLIVLVGVLVVPNHIL